MSNNQRYAEIVLKRAFDRIQMDFVSPTEHMAISEKTLNQSLLNQASNFCFWASVHAKIRSMQEIKKTELENFSDYLRKVLKAQLYDKCRTQLELDGEKITESKLENAIYSNAKYHAAIEELKAIQGEMAELNEELYMVRAVYDAMSMRKDLLITLSANLRSQYDPGV